MELQLYKLSKMVWGTVISIGITPYLGYDQRHFQIVHIFFYNNMHINKILYCGKTCKIHILYITYRPKLFYRLH